MTYALAFVGGILAGILIFGAALWVYDNLSIRINVEAEWQERSEDDEA